MLKCFEGTVFNVNKSYKVRGQSELRKGRISPMFVV